VRYWWVNQNQTYSFEVPGGFLWSPKTKKNGSRNYFYDTMLEVQPGDLVFSFCDTYIKAIGMVQRSAVTTPKPDFRTAGSNWSETGWFVEVEFSPVLTPIRPKDFMQEIRPLLADKYAPLQANGNGNQILYLTEISKPFGELLVRLSNASIPVLTEELAPTDSSEEDEAIESEVHAKHLDGDLEAIQIVKSRRGQGIFKANVRLVERACRVTRVAEMKHLRASHIKPWKYSTNAEKLDGNNGLLLSPHVDHLFDQGYISFANGGDFLVSKELSSSVLAKWSIDSAASVGGFTRQQQGFLDFHRDIIFRR
jgi:putative restriction endonuclease